MLLSIFAITSCSKNDIKSKPKDKQYIIDVVYVYDEALPTFNSITFLNLFRHQIPYLAKQTLGYDVSFNTKMGMSEKEFYTSTKRILSTHASMIKDSYLNVFDIKQSELSEVFDNAAKRVHYSRLEHLFDTANVPNIVDRYGEKNIKNIISIYNMKLSKRDKLFQNEYPFVNRAFYWAMIAASYKNADMIVVNMPIVSLNKKMDVKSIADGGFVDRVVARNEERGLGVNSVITTYPLLSNDSLFNSMRKNISQEDVQAEIFSYYIVQTIGIMLGGYDTLDNEAFSVMSEIESFQYETWYRNIKSVDKPVPPYKLSKEYQYSY